LFGIGTLVHLLYFIVLNFVFYYILEVFAKFPTILVLCTKRVYFWVLVNF